MEIRNFIIILIVLSLFIFKSDSQSLYYSKFDDSYKSLLNINNTGGNQNINLVCTNYITNQPIQCSIKKSNLNYYYLNIPIKLNEKNNIYLIKYLNKSITLNSPIEKNGIITTAKVQTFPSGPLIINQMIGKTGYPQLLFSLKEERYNEESPFITNNGECNLNLIRPLYGIGCNYTYFGILKLSDQTNDIKAYKNDSVGLTSVSALPLFFYSIKKTFFFQVTSNYNTYTTSSGIGIVVANLYLVVQNYSKTPFVYFVDGVGSNQIISSPYGILSNDANNNGITISLPTVFYNYTSNQSTSQFLKIQVKGDENVQITGAAPQTTPVVDNFSLNTTVVQIKNVVNDLYSIIIIFQTSNNYQNPLLLELSVKVGDTLKKFNPYNYLTNGVYPNYLTAGSLTNGTIDFYINGWGDYGEKIDMNITTISGKVFGIDGLNLPVLTKGDVDLYNDIIDISFLYGNVDLTNQNIFNIMYITFNSSSNILPSTPIKLITKPQLDKVENFAVYNSSSNKFQISFFMPSNILPGKYPYIISLSKSNYIENIFLKQTQQINVTSNNFDLMGPVFTSFSPFPLGSDGNIYGGSTSEFGWEFDISEQYNGFDYGYFLVIGDTDYRTYKIQINSSNLIAGDIWNGHYNISITSETCVSQSYRITEIVLYDLQGVNSTFIQNPSNITYISPTTTNPFMNFLNSPFINTLSLVCDPIPLPNGGSEEYPTLTLLKIYDDKMIGFESIDVSLNNIYYMLASVQINSGLSDKTPILYLTNSNNEIYKSENPEVYSKNNTHIQYRYKLTLSPGFGYPLGLSIGFYGLIGRYGKINGYSSYELKNLNILSYIEITQNFTKPIITDVSEFTSEGGNLYIYGKMLNLLATYTLTSTDVDLIPTGKIIYANSIYSIFGIPSVQKQSFNITFSGQGSIVLTINVKNVTRSYNKSPQNIQPYNEDCNFSNDSSEFEIISTPEPNQPQKCLGTPECGGSLKGICTSSGCQCKDGYIGLDCLSVITPTIPTLNDTSPSTNLNQNNTNNSNNTNSNFTTLVSIYGLREIDINQKVVQKIILKDKNWIQTKDSLNSDLYHYVTLVNQSSSSSPSPKLLNVSVDIEYFKNDKNITFAQQTFKIQKSSLKYSITISNYQFLNQLNSLELILFAEASINSSTDNTCSSKQFGYTTDGDNSNFIKLSVNDYSLYARLIRRGIIDNNKITTITNTLLDEELNSIDNSHNTQSYISFTIPNFKENAIIDPDFSLLIDSNNNNGNKICSNKSTNKISKGAIIGICLGVFGAAVILTASILLYRKRRQIKVNIQIKLGRINSN